MFDNRVRSAVQQLPPKNRRLYIRQKTSGATALLNGELEGRTIDLLICDTVFGGSIFGPCIVENIAELYPESCYSLGVGTPMILSLGKSEQIRHQGVNKFRLY
jgi:hypothetical protein